jgi:hypothetical protein
VGQNLLSVLPHFLHIDGGENPYTIHYYIKEIDTMKEFYTEAEKILVEAAKLLEVK